MTSLITRAISSASPVMQALSICRTADIASGLEAGRRNVAAPPGPDLFAKSFGPGMAATECGALQHFTRPVSQCPHAVLDRAAAELASNVTGAARTSTNAASRRHSSVSSGGGAVTLPCLPGNGAVTPSPPPQWASNAPMTRAHPQGALRSPRAMRALGMMHEIAAACTHRVGDTRAWCPSHRLSAGQQGTVNLGGNVRLR